MMNSFYYCWLYAQAFITTDKPIYKAGDLMFVQSYLVEQHTKKPVIKDDRGDEV